MHLDKHMKDQLPVKLHLFFGNPPETIILFCVVFFLKSHSRFYLTVLIMGNLKEAGGSRFAIPKGWKGKSARPFRRQLAEFLRFQRIVPYGQVFAVPLQAAEADEGGRKTASPFEDFIGKHLVISDLFHNFLLSVFVPRFTAARNPMSPLSRYRLFYHKMNIAGCIWRGIQTVCVKRKTPPWFKT